MKGLLICFTGIDGTGKTTLARWTDDFLAERGIICRYVWGSYEEWLAHPFISLGQRLFVRKQQKSNYAEYYSSVTKALHNPILSTLYQGFALTEYFLQLMFKVTLPVTLHRYIITDRYVYDTMVNIAVNLSYAPAKVTARVKRFLRLCSKPDIVFHLDAPPEVVIQRKWDIPSLEYEKKRRQLYLKLAEEFNFVSLDARSSLDEMKNQLGGHLEQLLKEKGF